MKHILTLKHNSYPHREEWYQVDEKTIHTKSYCPCNTPPYDEANLSIPEALEQYALMTSPLEGWEVAGDYGWHDLIDVWMWRYQETGLPVIRTCRVELNQMGGSNLTDEEFEELVIPKLADALIENGYWDIYKEVVEIVVKEYAK